MQKETINAIQKIIDQAPDHSIAGFLVTIEKLQKLFMLTFPFISFHSIVRDKTQRVTLAWDGLRIIVKKAADLPVPSAEEQWQALAGIAADAIEVVKSSGF